MFAKFSKLVLLPLLFSCILFSCNKTDNNSDTTYLKILNSEDYIADGLINSFEEEYNKTHNKPIKVIYDTFDTMENMYNTLKTGKTKYDLVCASEHMVQKLVNLGLVSKIDHKQVPNYDKNASSFIRGILNLIKWKKDKSQTDEYNLDDYCECYMWGTLGILYNPTYRTFVERNISANDVINDMKTYHSLWDKKYEKTISIKDSMRDTYAIGLIDRYRDELKSKTTVDDRQVVFNWGGQEDDNAQEHINEIKNNLLKLRENIFGFEVDSGKEDIITEKIGIDTAWSGDAVKSINNAEDIGLNLYYSIPEEGSNIWLDCWTMQTHDASDQEHIDASYKFLDYIARPENAIKNMGKKNKEGKFVGIGYTSSIADKTVFNYYKEKYQLDTTGGNYDLSYFFGSGYENIKVPEKYINRQMTAQFPDGKNVDKLMVMLDYGNNNDLILRMWEEVKHDSLPAWAIALFVVEVVVIAGIITFVVVRKRRNKKQRKLRKMRNN